MTGKSEAFAKLSMKVEKSNYFCIMERDESKLQVSLCRSVWPRLTLYVGFTTGAFVLFSMEVRQTSSDSTWCRLNQTEELFISNVEDGSVVVFTLQPKKLIDHIVHHEL